MSWIWLETRGFTAKLPAVPSNLAYEQDAIPFSTPRVTLHETITETPSAGAFHFSQAVLPLLLKANSNSPKHPPTLIFTGATASIKGSANFAGFAAGKFALRAMSQSLAREYGPKGVHVSHAIIDGVIDIPRMKEWDLGEGGKISSEAVSVYPFSWGETMFGDCC